MSKPRTGSPFPVPRACRLRGCGKWPLKITQRRAPRAGGRQASREGIRVGRKRGAQGGTSGAQDRRMARQAGYRGLSCPPPHQPPAKDTPSPAAPRPRDSGFPGGGAKQAPRAGPEPTSSGYPRPQRRGGRAGARKRPKPNSPRPPEKPTTPPVSLSPAAPGRPPRSSPRPPQDSRRRHEGSAGARVGVNGSARSRQGAHRCVTLGGPAPEAPSPAPRS